MAVMDVREVFDEREGADEDQGSRYQRVFLARTDNPWDGARTVLNHPLIPRRYSYYSSGSELDLAAICKRVRAIPYDSARTFWKVIAEYDTHLDPAQQEPNPLNRPPEIKYFTIQYTIPAIEDKDGNPIQNSAHERFDPPAERQVSHLAFTAARAVLDPGSRLEVVDTVNSTPWWGAAARRWRCNHVEAELQYERIDDDTTIAYWWTVLTFERHRKNWDLSILDQGFSEVVQGERIKIRDDHDDPVSEAVNLDGAGRVLPADAPAVFLSFRVYDELDFNALGLP
jgi:hypothetical protein